MSRASAGDVVAVKPTSDMYTVLVAAALIAQVIAFLVLFFRAGEIFLPNSSLFS